MALLSNSVILIYFISWTSFATGNNFSFPSGFKLGASTSAYQIEGAWNISDKGESVWDRFVHTKIGIVPNNETGDVACDSYHKYKEDVALLKELGFDSYRFSISWSRILPKGFAHYISQEGLTHYKNLLDELLANNIEPMVTIYHWDHPQVLEDFGGWTNEAIVDWYADYARIIFRELGSRIKYFITVNEPTVFCIKAYGEEDVGFGKPFHGIGEYMCVHNMLKAHARAYHIYQEEFKSTQNGSIGIADYCKHFYPKNVNDTISSKVGFYFRCGWTFHPIFSQTGDYSQIMKDRIAEKSKLQGYPRSRLPEFSQEWIQYIRGSSDFMGLNHYTANVAQPGNNSVVPSYYDDKGLELSFRSNWTATSSPFFYIAPEGFGDSLREIAQAYNNPVIYITENGVALDEGLEDKTRVKFFHDYVKELLIAVNQDGVNVRGYHIWSLLDNFEWESGYGTRFGIVHVDFNDPKRKRTRKKSALWWKRVLTSRRLESEHF